MPNITLSDVQSMPIAVHNNECTPGFGGGLQSMHACKLQAKVLRPHHCQVCYKSVKQLCHLKERLQKVYGGDAKKREEGRFQCPIPVVRVHSTQLL